MAQPLYLTYPSEWLFQSQTEHSWQLTRYLHSQNGSQHSYLTWKEPNPLTMIEWISPYIWPAHQNGYASQQSYLTWKELNPLIMTEWLSPYIWPTCQNVFGTHHFPLEETSIWRTPSFSLKYSNFTLANGFINTSTICSSVATYWSFTTPLYTISLIVILDLDMLRLAMEHRVLRQLHTTLVVIIYTSNIQLEIK